jgi:two-component system sensor histidine kinase YesM
VKWAEITILLAVFTLIILMGVRFALDLTRPLERLTKEIKLVESGNFNLPRDYRQGPERRDEIGAIQHDFEIMTGKIDELIRENYIKQLVIKDTQMKALQAQINPHFLYNTLESINWMAKVNGQADISLMAESLGNLLRGALKAKENTVSVGEELTLLQNYINIQKIRYEERLDFRMLVDDELKKYRIPPLTLQPIVENAIVYSLEKMNDVCLITVQFVTCDGNIKVFIKDNGPGIEPELLGRINSGEFKPRGFGIGLKNINERLKLVFGDEYGISVHSIQGTGTMVELLIPMRE